MCVSVMVGAAVFAWCCLPAGLRRRPMDTLKERSFGALLRRFRLAAGLSQEELAERAGMSARGISDLERGVHRVPYRHTLIRLSEVLGLDPDQRATMETATGP